MKLRPDDDIYRFQAVWRDLRGWELPFTARYVVWAAWVGVFLPLFFLISILTPFNFLITLTAAATVSAAVTYLFIADRITAENTLDALIAAVFSEAAAFFSERRHNAETRNEVTVRVTYEDLTEYVYQPEPSNNPVNWLRKPTKPQESNF